MVEVLEVFMLEGSREKMHKHYHARKEKKMLFEPAKDGLVGSK